MKKKTITPRRRTLLHIAHEGARQLWGSDEDMRRSIQEVHTGHNSCRDMDDKELTRWCWKLKEMGADIYVPAPAPRGSQDLTKPTTRQLAQIERLAFERGWEDGLDDKMLRGFIKHTAKVDDIRFASRKKASFVITALLNRKKQEESK